MRQLATQLSIFLVVLAILSPTERASGATWPRFRGPNGTGIATDKDIPVQWTDKDGIIWKTPIPGLGNSSPIVWNDRVFLQSATEDSKQRLLLCLNAADGKVLWKKPITWHAASNDKLIPYTSCASVMTISRANSLRPSTPGILPYCLPERNTR